LLLAIAAKAAIALGRWDEADGYLSTGLAREPVGVPGIRLRIQRARLDIARGDLPRATAALATARIADAAAGGTDDRASLVAALAELAAIQGHLTETRAAVGEGLRMAAETPPDPSLAQLAATGLRAEADAAAGARARRDSAMLEDARQRAGRIAEHVEQIAGLLGVPVDGSPPAGAPSRTAALTALCRAEARRVDDLDDVSAWAATAAAWEAIERPYPAAYARFRAAASILRDRGQRADARAALAESRRTAVRLGALPLLTEIDRLARQARLDLDGSDAATDAGPAEDGVVAKLGLTDRECEVLRLIGAGWSNQEIADALFISRKTASVHASHIFDKLGAANRSEAAAIAHRLGLAGGAPPPPGSSAAADQG
jgi:DNA-binding CsgD family transcriptional regulator